MRGANKVSIILLAALCCSHAANGQTQAASQQALLAGRAELQQQHYAQAIHLLEEGLKKFPADRPLKIELGRAYLYNRQDAHAMQLFREVLREEPSNRVAKLELARALGYQGDYEASNVLYRDLLNAGADEAAEVGLVRNLMRQHKTVEARRELEQGLICFPDNKQLREYKQKFELGQARSTRSQGSREPRPAAVDTQERLMGSVAYLSDSAGNRSWRSTQSFDYEFTRSMATKVQMEERTLWNALGPKANVLWASDDLKLRPTRVLAVAAGAGAVRFDNGSNRALYRGELELHPMKDLWLTGGFSRTPIAPTFLASQFNLLAEGWRARLDWKPGAWRLYGIWSTQHYSDGNHVQRADAELIRWFGSSHFAIATGYRFSYIGFKESLLHGYFSPRRYQSQLGVTGVRLGIGRHFRGEYLARIGGESISGAPYQGAWELALRNRILLRHWEIEGDYSYFHLAQNTGAFRAQSGRFMGTYRF